MTPSGVLKTSLATPQSLPRTPRPCRSLRLPIVQGPVPIYRHPLLLAGRSINLVEIILGKDTGDAALAAAFDYVRAIKKTPIVVNDSRGFYTSRVVGTYLREGHLMLEDGVPPAMIENVGRMAGMPVGPLALNDEVAVDLAWKNIQGDGGRFRTRGHRPRQKALLEEIVRRRRGRFGRKNGKGFYDYPQGAPKRLWPDLAELRPQLDPDMLDVAALKARLLAIQALKSARCIEEHVVVDMREADVGSILGFGFAPFTGGTISYIDGMGAKAFVDLCNRLAKQYGDRFKPCKLLRDMAKKGETFYRRFPPQMRTADREPPQAGLRFVARMSKVAAFSPGYCMARDQIDLTPIERRDDLVAWIAEGAKPKSRFRIGTGTRNSSSRSRIIARCAYDGRRSIRALLEGMQHLLGWQPIMEGPNIIGLFDVTGGGAISLEPGGQFELLGRAGRDCAPDFKRADGASGAGTEDRAAAAHRFSRHGHDAKLNSCQFRKCRRAGTRS